jgi:hypothetical protein
MSASAVPSGGQGHDAAVGSGGLAKIERFAKGRLQAVEHRQLRLGELVVGGWLGSLRRRQHSRGVVGVRLERGDGDIHPLVEG